MKAALPDSYTLRARWTPALIAGAPAFALFFAIISVGELSATKVVASLGLLALFIALSDFARSRGQAIQSKIMNATGGNPSTTMQRHRSNVIDKDSLSRIHSFLASQLDTSAPTEQDEARDPTAADRFYERGATWLREATRDQKKFKLVFEENMTYGFRRNLLGLKKSAISLNIVTLVAAGGIAYLTSPLTPSNHLHQGLLVVAVISSLHAFYFFAMVTLASACDASKLYARQLLLATESPHLRKLHVSRTPKRKA